MSDRGPRLLLAVAMAAAAWTWGSRQLLALEVFREQWAQDLAFFNQILHSASAGGPWTSPILLEPTGFFEMVHFHPVFALVLPIYALVPGTQTLVLLNVLAVVGAAWPLAELGRASSGRAWFGLLAGLSFLVWVPAESAAGADFRPMAFWVPALAWMLLGLYRGSWKTWVPAALVVCLSREESAYVLPLCGLFLLVFPFGGWRRRHGLGLVALGLGWLGVLLALKGNFFFHFHPIRVLENLSVAPRPSPELLDDRWSYALHSLAGGYALGPAAPAPLAMSAGPVWWLWTDVQREWHGVIGTTVYLRSALLPLWAGAGIVGAGWVARRWSRLAWPLGAWLVIGNLVTFRAERERLQARAETLHAEAAGAETAALHRLIQHVGPQDRVATEYKLMAALSGREVLWNVNHMYLEEGQPPHWTAAWPISLDVLDVVVLPRDHPFVERLERPDWVLRYQEADWGLWRRSATGPGPDPG